MMVGVHLGVADPVAGSGIKEEVGVRMLGRGVEGTSRARLARQTCTPDLHASGPKDWRTFSVGYGEERSVNAEV